MALCGRWIPTNAIKAASRLSKLHLFAYNLNGMGMIQLRGGNSYFVFASYFPT